VGARPFVVPAATLRRRAGTRRPQTLRGPVEGLDCSGSAVPAGAEVTADVVLESILGGVAVSGTVRSPWAGVCRRCLEPAVGEVRVAVRELFLDDSDGEDTYALDGDDVDLEPMVRDAVLLELPVAPLCRTDCAGLCPSCGADRNVGPCGCTPPADPRWAALDVLRPEHEPAGGEA
jgi:uncharacterized protein